MSAAEEPIDLGDARSRKNLRVILDCSDSGAPYKTIGNLILILRHDVNLAGLITLNEFTYTAELTRSPPMPEPGDKPLPGPYPRQWAMADEALILAYIQKSWMGQTKDTMLRPAMAAVAGMQGTHPVREWLGTLQWDGLPRLDTWLQKAFGASETDLNRDIGSKMLIAAVRRVRNPGCKFDFMVVLEGDQGIGKSTALSRLFTSDWFSDSLSSDLSQKDAAINLVGVWCMEIAEIDHLIRNSVETIKAFLARSSDKYRPPYGRSDVVRPRQGIIVGTTNSTTYLRDETGNRRFWPVSCAYVDLDWITDNRTQLWAEAAARESSGETIWIEEHEVRQEAIVVQQDRMLEDVWRDRVVRYVDMLRSVTTPEILETCLSIPTKDQGRAQQMRVASILTGLGWRTTTSKRDGVTVRHWKQAETQP